MRALRLAALLAFLLPAAPAAADGGWIPATLTCAGIWGTMADGNAVHYGAVAEPYWRPYPMGTVIELGDGGRWTIEDTLAPWVGGGFGRFDLYVAWGWACTQFGVRPGWARVVRYGWGGN
jgi:hypothetical protein